MDMRRSLSAAPLPTAEDSYALPRRVHPDDPPLRMHHGSDPMISHLALSANSSVKAITLDDGQKASVIIENGRITRILTADGQLAELKWDRDREWRVQLHNSPTSKSMHSLRSASMPLAQVPAKRQLFSQSRPMKPQRSSDSMRCAPDSAASPSSACDDARPRRTALEWLKAPHDMMRLPRAARARLMGRSASPASGSQVLPLVPMDERPRTDFHSTSSSRSARQPADMPTILEASPRGRAQQEELGDSSTSEEGLAPPDTPSPKDRKMASASTASSSRSRVSSAAGKLQADNMPVKDLFDARSGRDNPGFWRRIRLKIFGLSAGSPRRPRSPRLGLFRRRNSAKLPQASSGNPVTLEESKSSMFRKHNKSAAAGVLLMPASPPRRRSSLQRSGTAEQAAGPAQQRKYAVQPAGEDVSYANSPIVSSMGDISMQEAPETSLRVGNARASSLTYLLAPQHKPDEQRRSGTYHQRPASPERTRVSDASLPLAPSSHGSTSHAGLTRFAPPNPAPPQSSSSMRSHSMRNNSFNTAYSFSAADDLPLQVAVLKRTQQAQEAQQAQQSKDAEQESIQPLPQQPLMPAPSSNSGSSQGSSKRRSRRDRSDKLRSAPHPSPLSEVSLADGSSSERHWRRNRAALDSGGSGSSALAPVPQRSGMAGRWRKNFSEGSSGAEVDELMQVSSLQRLARARISEMEIVETDTVFEVIWHIPLNDTNSKITKSDRYTKSGDVVEGARRDGRPGVLRSQLNFTPEGHVHIRALQAEPFAAVFHDRIKMSTGGHRLKIEQKFQLLAAGVMPVKHHSIWHRVE
ncbi:hypothetical protein WJX72_003491 [[Myrmecia] bisecta]|uniref:Uncharacterized protein n=1 Tax=[Myrmecia] bisecta TaxID=41462 RepID=A0AAW1QEU4_9CHLO